MFTATISYRDIENLVSESEEEFDREQYKRIGEVDLDDFSWLEV